MNEATTTSFLVIWRLPGTTTTTGKGHCLSWLDYCFEYEVVATHSMADNDKPVTASSLSDCGAYSRRCAITNKKKRHGRCEAFLQGEAHRVSPFTIPTSRFPSTSFVRPRAELAANIIPLRPQLDPCVVFCAPSSRHCLCKPPGLRYTGVLLPRESISPHVQRIFPFSPTSR